MLYRIFTYIGFLFSATNQHGVHSPFVYNFVTKCLYIKSTVKGPQSIKVLLKSITYFRAKNVYIASQHSPLPNTIKKSFPSVEFNQQTADIIYLESPNNGLFDLIVNEGTYHNDSMVLINNIHQNKENAHIWESYKKFGEVTVTVDLYCCGALFFRKEQAKEHFKIRI